MHRVSLMRAYWMSTALLYRTAHIGHGGFFLHIPVTTWSEEHATLSMAYSLHLIHIVVLLKQKNGHVLPQTFMNIESYRNLKAEFYNIRNMKYLFFLQI